MATRKRRAAKKATPAAASRKATAAALRADLKRDRPEEPAARSLADRIRGGDRGGERLLREGVAELDDRVRQLEGDGGGVVGGSGADSGELLAALASMERRVRHLEDVAGTRADENPS